jgi:hypothetical protein
VEFVNEAREKIVKRNLRHEDSRHAVSREATSNATQSRAFSISQDKKILAFFLDIAFSYFYTFGNCNTRVADSM